MGRIIKIALLGVASWLVPFLFAFLFYSPQGELGIDIFLFKSIMIVTGSATGAALLVFYFRQVQENYLNEGIAVGLAWLATNLILDLLILLPMSGMETGTYFAQIGLRYLVIPVMSIAIGYILSRKK
ncbi:MAG: hypothetical protein J7K00_02530 [Candidatus Diapherotrites archaeon]|nr:hypothetical protein [Candidatus Diapherotrites archaeon]